MKKTKAVTEKPQERIKDYLLERIKYLITEEMKALGELDHLPAPSPLRVIKWNWIRELNYRRSELQMAEQWMQDKLKDTVNAKLEERNAKTQ